ncbi:MAG: hypothetical protein HRU50_13440 [Winogradskyella sp.]|uniref:hypothetical protein n=1 Tax=Winogradskyella sp. TaxID=1883156 RepID=UPI0025F36006|nr:hypothetical protein [Winogradskyella sp.]NRB60927.1 hypothetical protein [Winogradskyella sp.]
MSDSHPHNDVKNAVQKVQLVEGLFTPQEGNHIVNVLIEQKVNFHKLQRIKIRENSEEADTTYEDKRIEELIHEKHTAKSYLEKARKEGYNVVINGTLNISFVK